MKYTVIGDPHLKHSNMDYIIKLFDIVEKKGKPVIWLGDFLDTKEVVRSKCLNLLLEKLAASKLYHIILIGNHDWHNHDCKDHSLVPLKLLKNVAVIDEPKYINGMLFAPYYNDLDKLRKVLKDNHCNIVFAHLDVVDCDYGNGVLATKGLNIKELDKDKVYISGHYHKYQQVGNLTYLGTPFSHSFGESNQKKYIAEFDSKKIELVLEETKFPQHITLEVEAKNLKSLKVGKNHHYRVLVSGTEAELLSCEKHKLENIKYIEKATDSASGDSEISEELTNIEKFDKWARESKQLKEETIELGMEILENV